LGVVFWLQGSGVRVSGFGFRVQVFEMDGTHVGPKSGPYPFPDAGRGFWVQGFGFRVYRGTSLIRKRPPPYDHRKTLGIGLR